MPLILTRPSKTETGPALECRACTFAETAPAAGMEQGVARWPGLWSLEPAVERISPPAILPYLDSAEHIAVFVELDVPARAVVVDVLAIGDQRQGPGYLVPAGADDLAGGVGYVPEGSRMAAESVVLPALAAASAISTVAS